MHPEDKARLSRRDFLKLLAFLPAVWAPVQTISKISPQEDDQSANLPNILVFVYDALAADHMSLYGYPRETTPHISRFAEQATVYHRHYSAANFTTPGVASMLTGVYPWNHRGLHLFGSVKELYERRNIFHLLNHEYNTITYTQNAVVSLLLDQFLADIQMNVPSGELGVIPDIWAENYFKNDFSLAFWAEQLIRGYYFQPSSLFGSIVDTAREGRFANTLKKYADRFPRGVPHNYQGLYFILEDVIDWLNSNLHWFTTPFIAYIHLYPPHDPYFTRSDFIDKFKDGWIAQKKSEHHFSQKTEHSELLESRRHYDEYLAYADAEFGRLYDFIRSSGLMDNTHIIFTSDHGEMFERGIVGHDNPTLYNSLIKVPLIISNPGQKRRQDVHFPTSGVDLFPTILKIAGLDTPSWCEGVALPPFSSGRSAPERSVYAFEAKSSSKWGPINQGTIALVKGGHKMIHYFGYPGFEDVFEYYDIAEDPGEIRDIYNPKDKMVSQFQDEINGKILKINGTDQE